MRQHRTFKVYNSKREKTLFSTPILSLLDNIYGSWLVTVAISNYIRSDAVLMFAMKEANLFFIYRYFYSTE